MSTTEKEPIELAIAQTPSIALLDPVKKQELYTFLEREIEVFVPDLSTEKGRKAIAALAYKIARTKSAIDDAGALIKAEWLKKSQEIDAGRREIRERLDALKEKAREPLTRWEKDEEQRQAIIKGMFDYFRDVRIIKADDTSESVSALLTHASQANIDHVTFQDMYDAALGAKASAVSSLRNSLEKILEQEFDREELARLREESAKRAEEDRKAAEAAELARLNKEREEREAQRQREKEEARKQAEEDRVRREAEITAKAKQEAEERTKRELELRHAHELKEMREANERSERERQAEAKRQADEAARLNTEAAKKLADEKRLAANKKHRGKIIEAATMAIVDRVKAPCSFDPDLARDIVMLIVDGVIPNVSINFTGEAK